jgi:hypothetical protein
MGNAYSAGKEIVKSGYAGAGEGAFLGAQNELLHQNDAVRKKDCESRIAFAQEAAALVLADCKGETSKVQGQFLEASRKLDIATWFAIGSFIAFLITLVILIVTGAKNKKKLDELRNPAPGAADSQVTWSFL